MTLTAYAICSPRCSQVPDLPLQNEPILCLNSFSHRKFPRRPVHTLEVDCAVPCTNPNSASHANTVRYSRHPSEMREANETLISSHSRHVYNFGTKPYPSEQSPLSVTRAFGAQTPPKLVSLEQALMHGCCCTFGLVLTSAGCRLVS